MPAARTSAGILAAQNTISTGETVCAHPRAVPMRWQMLSAKVIELERVTSELAAAELTASRQRSEADARHLEACAELRQECDQRQVVLPSLASRTRACQAAFHDAAAIGNGMGWWHACG